MVKEKPGNPDISRLPGFMEHRRLELLTPTLPVLNRYIILYYPIIESVDLQGVQPIFLFSGIILFYPH